MKNLDVEEPELVRSRKRPRRYEEGDEPYAHENPKDKYKSIYFEALDFVINAIQDRINQPDFKMYAVMQNIILKSVRGENVVGEMKKLYSTILKKKYHLKACSKWI